MPSHPDRVRRASLPEGYQFGDACDAATRFYWSLPPWPPEDGWRDAAEQMNWRAPNENAAKQLRRRAT